MKNYKEHIVLWCTYCHFFLEASLDNQVENLKKTDRFGTNWWGSESWMSDHQVPVLIGPPLQKANFERPRGKIEQIRPPAPLEQIHPPAPLIQSTSPPPNIRQQKIENDPMTRVHSDDIMCVRSNGLTLFTARIIPPREFTSLPVFEDAGNSYSPSDCHMRSTFDSRKFEMHVQHFSKCGVRIQQDAEGKEWISVTLRFPFVEGLRMAEDEYVMIMCRPQERTALSHHVMDMRLLGSEERSFQRKKVFRSSTSHDVSCKISLMTTLGTKSFVTEVKTGHVVRVGQDLQIRARVREGDGWNYAMLKEVVISRAFKEDESIFQDFSGTDASENAVYSDKRIARQMSHHSSVPTSAQLVFNGCRNPVYKVVAHRHPQRDPSDPLVVSFTFRAFMFQNMVDGEALRLSIQVVACAQHADCQPRNCDDISPRNSGGRKRRESENKTMSHTKNFTEDLELVVALGGFSKMPLTSPVEEESITADETWDGKQLLVISVSSGAILLCLSLTVAVAIAVGNQKTPCWKQTDIFVGN